MKSWRDKCTSWRWIVASRTTSSGTSAKFGEIKTHNSITRVIISPYRDHWELKLAINFPCVCTWPMGWYVVLVQVVVGGHVWISKALLARWFVLEVPMKRASLNQQAPSQLKDGITQGNWILYCTVPLVTKVSVDVCPWFLPSFHNSNFNHRILNYCRYHCFWTQ